MIKSRRLVKDSDNNRSCCGCLHLRIVKQNADYQYKCMKDGCICPDRGFVAISICDYWKETKKND